MVKLSQFCKVTTQTPSSAASLVGRRKPRVPSKAAVLALLGGLQGAGVFQKIKLKEQKSPRATPSLWSLPLSGARLVALGSLPIEDFHLIPKSETLQTIARKLVDIGGCSHSDITCKL